ncbi:MAG: biotin transporter BioY [Atribacterota bacterium]|jgi:biotin transport system substrate-specific component|nr:biotin transporter BioY [Atribacterota bacterium]
MFLKKITLKDISIASLLASLTALGAFIIIPLYPVPITLQNLFTYLAAMVFGKKIGLLSQIIYISMGIAGLPVFAAGKTGLGILFGPTGGYLWGFIISAYIIGFLVEKNNLRQKEHFFYCGLLGATIINLFGALQLYLVTRLSITAILFTGVIPFFPGDLIKVILAAILSYKLKLILTSQRAI